MKRWIMVIDIAKCHNCNNCSLACRDEHVDNNWSPISCEMPRHSKGFRTIELKERGSYPLIDVAYKPGNCMMCENAPCVKAGKGAVYRRDDGIVLIDNEKAVGRKDIVEACPYGAISWNEKLLLPQKCTFCAHLLDSGWTETRCSQICPTGATKFMQIEEEELEAYIRENELARYKDELGTRPSVFYKNLYRFTSLAVFGSVIKDDECLNGAVVKAAGEGTEYSTLTNAYGDFRLDGLKKGDYILYIEGGGNSYSAKISLSDSINIGDIVL